MTNFGNEPTEQPAMPKRKAKWVGPALKRLHAGDAQNGGTINSDGYLLDIDLGS
jgi:hypothetical protein